MLIKVTCNKCKQEVAVPLYFYDVRIIVEEDFNHSKSYVASALGKAICPCCGNEIYEQCRSPIFNDDIIKLATRRHSKV